MRLQRYGLLGIPANISTTFFEEKFFFYFPTLLNIGNFPIFQTQLYANSLKPSKTLLHHQRWKNTEKIKNDLSPPIFFDNYSTYYHSSHLWDLYSQTKFSFSPISIKSDSQYFHTINILNSFIQQFPLSYSGYLTTNLPIQLFIIHNKISHTAICRLMTAIDLWQLIKQEHTHNPWATSLLIRS